MIFLKAALALGALAETTMGNSLFLAQKCRNMRCSDPARPILDFDEARGCTCAAHPCWDDRGLVHDCPDGFHLGFFYEKITRPNFTKKKIPPYKSLARKELKPRIHRDEEYQERTAILKCQCSVDPHYSSTYIAEKMCPGHACAEKKFPVLDWDAKEGKCICSSHPCVTAGIMRKCKDPKLPIMHYREDKHYGKVERVCECLPRFQPPTVRSEGNIDEEVVSEEL